TGLTPAMMADGRGPLASGLRAPAGRELGPDEAPCLVRLDPPLAREAIDQHEAEAAVPRCPGPESLAGPAVPLVPHLEPDRLPPQPAHVAQVASGRIAGAVPDQA